MEEAEALLTELQQIRERATGLIRAKLGAIAEQFRAAAARAESDLDVVVPPDPEALFPLAHVAALIPAAPPPPAPRPTLDAAVLRALDAGRAQSEVLQELLRRTEPWCGSRAVVVFRDGRATGWAGAGFASPDAVRSWQGPIAASPALTRAASGTPVLVAVDGDGLLSGWLGGSGRALVVPMSLRGNVVGAFVAAADGELEAEPIQMAVYVTGLLLETLNMRPAVPTPALCGVEELTAAAVEIEEPGAVFAAPPPVVEEVAEIAIEEVPPPAVVAEEAPDEALPQFADAGATVQLRVPVTPVVPARSPEAERKHEEAKRFARLLVSEIRLYNEQAVADGRQNHDIYLRLKEDIDRSREMYEQRVMPEIRAESNYFFEELVRILADGDPDALGL